MLILFRTFALLFKHPSGMHPERRVDTLIANLRRCIAMHRGESDERDASFIREGFSEDNMWGSRVAKQWISNTNGRPSALPKV